VNKIQRAMEAIREDKYLAAVARLEKFADAKSTESHKVFLRTAEDSGHSGGSEYERGRADAFTDVIEYLATMRILREMETSGISLYS
jgi:hypothetical protein